MSVKKYVYVLVVLLLAGAPVLAGNLVKVDTPVGGDLMKVAWHPSEEYALVVGEGIYKFLDAGSGYVLQVVTPTSPIICTAVDWHPSGAFALIGTNEGYIYYYDGEEISELSTVAYYGFMDIEFSPDGQTALMVGWGGLLYVYDSSTGKIADLSVSPILGLRGVTWHPSGVYALIAGSEGMSEQKILRFENGITTEVSSGGGLPGGIDFDPTGTYCIVPEEWGKVSKFDPLTGREPLETSFYAECRAFDSVTFSPVEDLALITGGWTNYPFPDQHVFVEYCNGYFNAIRMDSDPACELLDAAFKADGSMAVVTGEGGSLYVYDPTIKIVSDISCDQDFYSAGDLLTLKLDLMNFGPWTEVDLYLMLDINESSFYWPLFTPSPIVLPLKLHKGFKVEDYPLWQCIVPRLTEWYDFTWKMYTYEKGQISSDYRLSFSQDQFSIDVP